MARRAESVPPLPLLLVVLLLVLLLPAALAHAGEQAKTVLQPQHTLDDLLQTESSQDVGSKHSTKRHAEQTRQHSGCQSSLYDLTCKCPLCPVCSSAQACPSPCPSIPKCHESQQCPTPCPACPACPSSCKKLIPPGYEHFKGLGYYRLHTVPLDWFAAKATCEREGAHLAIINSQDEANLMKALFSRDPDLGIWIFLGFHDLYKEGKYVTVLGEPLSQTGYFTWNPHQPDNNENNENCGSMYASGGLNDLVCSFKQAFVCELPV